jgi:hypothetical protein
MFLDMAINLSTKQILKPFTVENFKFFGQPKIGNHKAFVFVRQKCANSTKIIIFSQTQPNKLDK